jgi:hypothetical protein
MNYCQINPEGSFPSAKRIITVGDIHGDLNALTSILFHSRLIDKNMNWIAHETHLVIMGDILDRGSRTFNNGDEKSEYTIIKLLINLRKHARRYQSEVHILLGNHELMNIFGNFSYTSPLGMTDFDGKRKEYLRPGGKIAKLLACNSVSILKIGSWLFSHAGVLPEISSRYSIDAINGVVREFILGNISVPENDIINTSFWHRQYAGLPNCAKAIKANNDYNVKSQVIGHNVQKNGINSSCSGALFRVDIGLSKAFGLKNRYQYLEILNDVKPVIIII